MENELLQFGKIMETVKYLIFSMEVMVILLAANGWYTLINGSVKIVLNGNIAAAIQRAGYLFGVSIAMIAAISNVAVTGFGQTFLAILTHGLTASLFVLAATYVNDKIITSGIDDNYEIRERKNIAVAVVEASASIATGLITAASLSGNENAPWITPVVFFVLGQFALIVTAKLYVRFTNIENSWLVKNSGDSSPGNVAAGISLGGMIIATGVILRNAILGPFVSWEDDLLAFSVSFVVGISILFLVSMLIPRIFFGNARNKYSDEIYRDNRAYSIFTAICKIILAFAVGMMVPGKTTSNIH